MSGQNPNAAPPAPSPTTLQTPTPAPAAPSAPSVPPSPAAPDHGPVPYSRFKEVNDELGALRARVQAFEQGGAQHETRVSELEGQLQASKQSAELRVALALAGAEGQQAVDYFAWQYRQLAQSSRPKPTDYVQQVKQQSPQFFRADGAAQQPTPATPPPAPATPPATPEPLKQDAPPAVPPAPPAPMPSNPDANASPSSAPTADQPLSQQVIASMSQEEFNRRWDEIMAWGRANGGRG